MLYVDEKFSYSLEECMWKYSEDWKKILFNVLKVKIAVLANKKERMKLKEVDLYGMTLSVINEALPIFDKFLVNIKGYTKQPMIDEYDGTDITLQQEVNYKVLLHPFDGFFDEIEVK